MAACDIFIRSYWKDFAWLELCLAAIEKYCHGFRSVIVVVPQSSQPWLRRFPKLTGKAQVEFCRDYRDDYLGQQATKLMADTFTDSTFICHVDSDCIFCRPTAPTDLIIDGTPRIIMRPYTRLGRHLPWRKPTETFLGWEVTHDFMQHPPFTYPRWLYPKVREHATAVHGINLEKYITTRPQRGFSEFNVMGALAYVRYPSRFSWIDNSEVDPGTSSCRWYWSWGGLDGATLEEIETILDA